MSVKPQPETTDPGPGGAVRRRALPREGDGTRLDRLVHQPARLAIVSALAVNKGLSFNELKELLGLSDGNLSVHARKLEEAGYVATDKSFVDRVPRTRYELTPAGRQALEGYLAHMERLIEAVRGG